ncbi:hypothetical protein L596_024102 [Steinernema carpocapsae]|uniref:Uncharacterized protein n=1 Tax=Steinernema carpocapsae TaxID=34508 RepID=A0A4U5MFQ1_STECR|nr:hypothetical protein L596_024102 [Steinernema carpocapsae]
MSFGNTFILLFLLTLPLVHSGVIRRTPPYGSLVERDMAIFFIDGSILLGGHRRFRSRRGFRKGVTYYSSSRKQRRFLSKNINGQAEDEEDALD